MRVRITIPLLGALYPTIMDSAILKANIHEN